MLPPERVAERLQDDETPSCALILKKYQVGEVASTTRFEN
jgi:hypothetical protein